eukprot:1195797-Prorocentrum_minimum.AAC.10
MRETVPHAANHIPLRHEEVAETKRDATRRNPCCTNRSSNLTARRDATLIGREHGALPPLKAE